MKCTLPEPQHIRGQGPSSAFVIEEMTGTSSLSQRTSGSQQVIGRYASLRRWGGAWSPRHIRGQGSSSAFVIGEMTRSSSLSQCTSGSQQVIGRYGSLGRWDGDFALGSAPVYGVSYLHFTKAVDHCYLVKLKSAATGKYKGITHQQPKHVFSGQLFLEISSLSDSSLEKLDPFS
ncbi:hypothetical protein J6590_013737 [Homalodisca vitripennis]|nr:hypothetical protein J6590_013737 [Homalodisca vitripennis]